MIMGFLNKLGYKKANRSIKETKLINNKTIVTNLLSLILNDEYLSVPVYIHGMENEEQANYFGNLYPLLYIWNEYINDEGNVGFSFSMNGKVIGSMLEEIVPRTNVNFIIIRDEVMSVLHQTGQKSALVMIEETASLLSNLFKNLNYLDLIDINYKS